MGGGASKEDAETREDAEVAAMVANVKRNEVNVFDIPFQVAMTKGKMHGHTVTVPCPPTDSVWALKERIAAVTGDSADELSIAYGEGDEFEGKLLFIEAKGSKSFKFDEDSILIRDCRCNKRTKLACNASKEINLDAQDPENRSMLRSTCDRALAKPMKTYVGAYKQAVNQWVDEQGLPDKEEDKGGPKVPFEHFHREAVKHATLTFADPRKHKTWSHKFHAVKADSEEDRTKQCNVIFHDQVRRLADDYLAVFYYRVEKALEVFPSYIVGHTELVWNRINEVVDERIYETVDEYKVQLHQRQDQRIRNAIYAKLWFDDDVESMVT